MSQCVCASAGDTIAWLASGSSRVMQKLLVVLLIPLCQCHKKHHQSSEAGGPDHPPYTGLCVGSKTISALISTGWRIIIYSSYDVSPKIH